MSRVRKGKGVQFTTYAMGRTWSEGALRVQCLNVLPSVTTNNTRKINPPTFPQQKSLTHITLEDSSVLRLCPVHFSR